MSGTPREIERDWWANALMEANAEVAKATALSAADHLAAEAAENENDRLRAALAAATARAEQAEAELETLRRQLGKPRETGDERDRAVWCWTPNPHGRLHCGRLAGHDGPHKRGEREWHDAEDGGEPT